MTVQAGSELAKKARAGDIGGVFTATVVSTRRELDQYADEWNELLGASAADSIFLTWEWISAWLHTVNPDAPLLTVAVRNTHGELVAVAPFYRSTLCLLGFLKYKCLRAIGDCLCGSEYPDIIVRQDCEEEALALVMKTLLKYSTAWECIYLPKVAGWTGAYERFRHMFVRDGVFLHERPEEFSAVALPDTYESYLMALSRNKRGQVRRKGRRFSESHDVEVIRCSSKDELHARLSDLFSLHRRRWESVGQAGSFVRKPLMRRFYEHFALEALRQGWLRLYALSIDGVVRAVQYGYAYEGKFSQLQEGYDPETSYSIGNILRSLVIKACIEEGLAEYDFLGEFSDHKRRWGAKLRGGYTLFIGRKSLKNRLLFWKNVWPSGRYIREIT